MSTDTCKLTHPCGGCPFARHVPAGGTGGADPSRFIGQAYAGMWLPCHRDPHYVPYRATREDVMQVQQCAGAAIFRANCGVPVHQLLHQLPADPVAVFADPAELLVHHRGIPLAEARHTMAMIPAEYLAARELRDPRLRATPTIPGGTEADIVCSSHGSLLLLAPVSTEADSWLHEHVNADGWQWQNGWMMADSGQARPEPRFAKPETIGNGRVLLRNFGSKRTKGTLKRSVLLWKRRLLGLRIFNFNFS